MRNSSSTNCVCERKKVIRLLSFQSSGLKEISQKIYLLTGDDEDDDGLDC